MKNFLGMYALRVLWIGAGVAAFVAGMGLAMGQPHPGGATHEPTGGHVGGVVVGELLPADPSGTGMAPYMAYLRVHVGHESIDKSDPNVIESDADMACWYMSRGHTAGETSRWMWTRAGVTDWQSPMYVALVYGAQKYMCNN